MKVTDREKMAYAIRRDAALAQAWIAQETGRPDAPQRPGRITAAQHFADWCDGANSELLSDPDLDLEQVKTSWSLAAVASDIRLRPHELATAATCLATLLVGTAAAMRLGSWWYLIAGAIVTAAIFVWSTRLKPRLAVGPHAHRDLSAALLIAPTNTT